MSVVHPPGVWTVEVGWTSSRPIRVDEHRARVVVHAGTEAEAVLVAAQMVIAVGGWRQGIPGQCEMATSTQIVSAEF